MFSYNIRNLQGFREGKKSHYNRAKIDLQATSAYLGQKNNNSVGDDYNAGDNCKLDRCVLDQA